MMRIPLANGNMLTVPVADPRGRETASVTPDVSSTIQSTQLWKNINNSNAVAGDRPGKNGTPVGVR